eukprot:ANDGO_07989.mRNA.1 hypothetical protein
MIRILAHRLGSAYMPIMLHVLNAVRNVAHLTPGIPSCRFRHASRLGGAFRLQFLIAFLGFDQRQGSPSENSYSL